MSANDCFQHFKAIVTELSDDFIPVKTSCNDKPPWSLRPPTSLVRRRQEAWQNYKNIRQRLNRCSSEVATAYQSFAAVNRQHRGFATNCQAEYESDLITRLKTDPKLLHSYIRKRKVGSPSIGPLTMNSGVLSDKPDEMAEILATSFASVFTQNDPVNPAGYQQFDGSFTNINITAHEVLSALSHVDPNSAMGPDGIHPTLLKNCAAEVAYPLQMIFSRSLQEGCVPSEWRSSLVVPIYKKGPRYEPLNYRPISLTSVCCKTMERIICTHLRAYLESNFLLSSNQFGFRSGRSTSDQLLIVYNSISKQVDLGGLCSVILFDFCKAFDVVCHNILLSKLCAIGVDGNLLHWISSFLKNRVMKVCVKGSLSQSKDVLSGVPQGSVLGPLLFLVYVNNIADQLSTNYKIFADDLKLYACVGFRFSGNAPPPSSVTEVQRDIDALHSTASSWGLAMNPKKCVVIHFPNRTHVQNSVRFTLGGQPLLAVTSHTDLGVIIDSDLKFHEHVHSIVHKAGGLAQSLLKSTVCRSPDFMLFLLTSHIRPIIEYCSCLWNVGYLEDLRKLEKIQRSWTKKIDGLSSLSYADRLQFLNLYSVQGRLLRADLIQCWKIFNGKSCLTPADLFDVRRLTQTRGHCHKIFTPRCRTDVRKRFFSIRCISQWNSLPAAAVCAPDIGSFKRMLESCVTNELFAYV